MDFISKEQLIEEMRGYQAQLQGDVEFFACNVGWYGRAKLEAVKAELKAVVEFLGYLVGKVAKVTNRTRCSFHKEIRRAFAIAKDCGLNVEDKPAMRRAFGRALGRRIETREEMNASDWQTVGRMMKRGALAW